VASAVSKSAVVRPHTYTTGSAAKLCGVSPRTVTKWTDSGQLKHYRIPGSRDRRIYAHHLADFMRANGMDLPPELKPLLTVVFGLADLAPPPGFRSIACDFDLGVLAVTEPVGAAVLGDDDGLTDAIRAADLLRHRNPACRLVLVVGPDRDPAEVAARAGCPVLVRPVTAEQVTAALAE
jgi:excisionase family DNA binding protein